MLTCLGRDSIVRVKITEAENVNLELTSNTLLNTNIEIDIDEAIFTDVSVHVMAGSNSPISV